MTRFGYLLLVSILVIIAAVAWFWPSGLHVAKRPFPMEGQFASTSPSDTLFVEGNVVRDNPGQKPGIWYLLYDAPGAPDKTVELQFLGTVPELVQGARVRVGGTLASSSLAVRTIDVIATSTEVEGGRAVKLYYYNASRDQGAGGAQCSAKGLVAVSRTILRSETPLTNTVRLLLRGELSPAERTQGLTSEFPLEGVSLDAVAVADNVATLVMSDPEHKLSGGACRVAVLRAQIEATVKQFEGVHRVEFVPATLFQP